jgi:hypothetical protein
MRVILPLFHFIMPRGGHPPYETRGAIKNVKHSFKNIAAKLVQFTACSQLQTHFSGELNLTGLALQM